MFMMVKQFLNSFFRIIPVLMISFVGIIVMQIISSKWKCIWRILTAGFAEQNGRNAKLNGRITFDY